MLEAGAMKSLAFEHRFKSPIALVWRAISDTDRFNKALGFPPVVYRDEPQPDGTSRRFCRQARFGIELEYEELPFSWVHERSFRVERLYAKGPVSRLIHTCHLEPDGAGCFARVIWDWEPRSALDALVAKTTVKQMALKPFQRVFKELDATFQQPAVTNGAPMPRIFSEPRGPAVDVRSRIDPLLSRARQIYDSPLLARLADALVEKSDADLRRMQPRAYARSWSSDLLLTIDTFLAATRAGLLRMRWDVICPHCRGDKKNLASLSEATERAFCSACNVDFDVDLDRSLEAVFTPHPQVRTVEEARYCLGGPGATPHIHYQRLLEAGEEDTVELPLPPGRYRLRFTGEKTYRWIDVKSGASAAEFDLGDGAIGGEDAALGIGTQKLTIRNRARRRTVVNLESVFWAADALSAGELIADQRFRDLFSGEILAPGIKLAVERATILFTDLVGSTAMYEALGDASAFSLVWTHFDVLREIIGAHHGAIVKTIGDAIMAVFMLPEDALLAAAELHQKVDAYCKERGHVHPVMLKIGIHEGPCIAVTLNERLDYFGSTVNLSARVEAQSKGGDIIVSKTLADHTKDAASLRTLGWASEAIAAHCKGFAEPIPMLRFTRPAIPEFAAPRTLPAAHSR
jgi:class 3 adenylate cyclase